MAYTQEQLVALEAAIAQGVLTVEYSDKKVTYRSLSEMYQILDNMRNELGLGKRTRFFASHNKGLHNNNC